MLIENLYTIDSFKNDVGKTEAVIAVNAEHEIFEGHFPGQPILPGVCQLQIIKELLEKSVGKKLFLTEAAQCKFLQMVDPRQTNILIITIDYKEGDSISCNATIKNGDVFFLKMNAVFTVQ